MVSVCDAGHAPVAASSLEARVSSLNLSIRERDVPVLIQLRQIARRIMRESCDSRATLWSLDRLCAQGQQKYSSATASSDFCSRMSRARVIMRRAFRRVAMSRAVPA